MAPGKPADKSFAELVNIIINDLSPRPSRLCIVPNSTAVLENKERQSSNTAYVAELRSLSEHCDFRDQLEEMMRDRLVCGVNDERIQRRLLAESRLDFKKALELATGMEIADKNTCDIQQGNSVEKPKEQPVNRLSKQQVKHAAKECYRCGGKFHEAEKCRYKDEKCYRCHKKGRKAISVVPTRKQTSETVRSVRTHITWKRQVRKKRQKKMGRNIRCLEWLRKVRSHTVL